MSSASASNISIVIPFHNEEANVDPVLTEVRREYPDAEIIAVDDASTDGTAGLLARHADVSTFRLPSRLGQSAAVYRGLVEATGDLCVILDGDGQSCTADIKRLLEFFPEYDFATGRRARRNDTRSRVLASRFANFVRNLILHDGFQDTGGTPKVLKRECVAHLIPFDGMHRYIPALLVHAGARGIEVPVGHRDRLHGTTKYTNWGRGLRGVRDLLGVRWLLSRRIDAGALGVVTARRPVARPATDEPKQPRTTD